MRWRGLRRSTQVDDRRGQRRRRTIGGGLGGILVILLLVMLGADPARLMQQLDPGAGPAIPQGRPAGPADDELADFVSAVLGSTEDVWGQLLQTQGAQYRRPTLVLFEDSVSSACGFQSAAVGPFYCPADQHVYLDLGFFREMKQRLGAPGDFAQAYVIAHEVGHHVQNLLGISDQVRSQQQRVSREAANELSVRLELQADFLAGVWAHHAQRNWQLLEEGDLEEALNAAAAIGDDRLQMQSRGYVVPESFTHGSSAQRVRWFRKGLLTGDLSQANTFEAAEL